MVSGLEGAFDLASSIGAILVSETDFERPRDRCFGLAFGRLALFGDAGFDFSNSCLASWVGELVSSRSLRSLLVSDSDACEDIGFGVGGKVVAASESARAGE